MKNLAAEFVITFGQLKMTFLAPSHASINQSGNFLINSIQPMLKYFIQRKSHNAVTQLFGKNFNQECK